MQRSTVGVSPPDLPFFTPSWSASSPGLSGEDRPLRTQATAPAADPLAHDEEPCGESQSSSSERLRVDLDRLRQQWIAFKALHPTVVSRTTGRALAARELTVTEAELMAVDCADGRTTRLFPAWKDLLPCLAQLGRVRALSYRPGLVIESFGRFGEPSFTGGSMTISSKRTQLSGDLERWTFGFAEAARSAEAPRRSLEVFNESGAGFFKVHVEDAAQAEPFEQLLQDFSLQGPLAATSVRPQPEKGPRRPGSVPKEAAEEAPPAACVLILRAAARRRMPIAISLTLPEIVHRYVGPIHTLTEKSGGLNIVDPGFHLHLRTGVIESASLVRKPGRPGEGPRLDFLDHEGRGVLTLGPGGPPDLLPPASWLQLVEEVTQA